MGFGLKVSIHISIEDSEPRGASSLEQEHNVGMYLTWPHALKLKVVIYLRVTMIVQGERDSLMAELESLATTTDENTQKLQETYKNKLKQLEAQV
jgi:Tfp pilus assembly protein PilO